MFAILTDRVTSGVTDNSVCTKHLFAVKSRPAFQAKFEWGKKENHTPWIFRNTILAGVSDL